MAIKAEFFSEDPEIPQVDGSTPFNTAQTRAMAETLVKLADATESVSNLRSTMGHFKDGRNAEAKAELKVAIAALLTITDTIRRIERRQEQTGH